MGTDTEDGKYHVILTQDGVGELIIAKTFVEDGADLLVPNPEVVRIVIYAIKPESEDDI